MKKIIFVNPPLTLKERYGVSFQSGGETPPLGLASLAAVTRKNGYITKILDASALKLNIKETVSEIIKFEPDYVGFTAVTISIHIAAEIAREVKNKNKKVKILLGGPHLTAVPEITMQLFPIFEIGCIGEAENSIIELLTCLDKGDDLSKVKGLVYKFENKILFTAPRERIKDLDKLPFPAWDLLPDLKKYYCPPVHTLKKIPAALLVTSRGCPGKCMFCDRSIYGNRCTMYSADYVVEMIIELYEKYGIKEIQFRDDNFIVFTNRLKQICEKLIEKKLDLVWSATGRVDMFKSELLQLMKKAGCWQIWYGIESGSERVLKVIKKYTTVEQIRNVVKLTKENGIEPCGFFIIGHPTETKDSIEETINLACKLPLAEAHFTFMTPFPGSELYQNATQYGFFDNDWKKLSGWFPVFIPYGLTKKDLEYYNKKSFIKFYFRLKIIISYIKKLRSWKHFRVYLNGFLSLIEYVIKPRKFTV